MEATYAHEEQIKADLDAGEEQACAMLASLPRAELEALALLLARHLAALERHTVAQQWPRA